MKQHLLELARSVSSQSSDWNARNVVREYLQARILEELVRAGAMASLAFLGGTALRLLYGLKRYSEDLDFSLEGDRTSYDPQRWAEKITRQFRRESYEVLQRTRASTVVHRVDFGFPSLLFELGLSPHAGEVLRIRMEVDTNPPAGATTTTSRIRKHTSVRVRHHDRPSLLAGKLLAVLNRPWPKGRDYYDLLWYLEQDPRSEPNLTMLNAGMAQQDANAQALTQDNWRHKVADRVLQVSWDRVIEDITRMVESRDDIPLKNDLLALLGRAPEAP